MKKKITAVLIFCFLSSLIAQDRLNKIDSRIVAWTINYYSNNSNRLTRSDVHCFLIEEVKKSNGSILALYNVGLNRSGIKDLILVFDTEQSASNLIRPIGNLDYKTNLSDMFDFFGQHEQFSDKSRVACYEKLIIGGDDRIYKKKTTRIGN